MAETCHETLGIKAPRLSELKERPCSLEEIQAALVKFMELYNEQGRLMDAAIRRKADKEWRADI